MLTVDHFARIRQRRRDGLTVRQIAAELGHSPKTILKALADPEPKPFQVPPRPAPVFGPFRAIVDAILAADEQAPPKQRHTARQIFRRLVREHRYPGQYDFGYWCKRFGRVPLPALPETVAFYLVDCAARLKASTLQRRLATIAEAHKTAGVESPTRHAQVRLVWAGIRRENGVAQSHRRPVLTRHLKAMLAHLPDSLVGVRDRALLLIGFAGAMRRSELVSLDVSDVAIADEGLVVLIRKSKTDPNGVGRKVGIPFGRNPDTCPVKAIQAWLDASKLDDGPLFRRVDRHGFLSDHRLCGRTVADVVQRSLLAAGKSTRLYSGHSLRAGPITQAAMAGVSERAIADQSGHKSLLVLRRYIRDGSLFRENAAAKVGL